MEENENAPVTNEVTTPQVKKGANHTAIIAIIVLALVVAIGVRGYYFYRKIKMSNPIYVTTELIKKLDNASKEVMDSNIYNKDKATKMNISGTINDYDFKLDAGIDLNNNLVSLLANLSSGNNALLYLDGTLNQKGLLFSITKGSNYKLDYDFKEVFDELKDGMDDATDVDTSKFINYLATSFQENYKEDYFTKTNQKLVLFDDELSVDKYETKITEDNFGPVIDSFVEKLSADEDFINLVIDIAKKSDNDLTKQEVIDGLKEAAKEAKAGLKEVDMTYTIYVNKADAVRIVFAEKDAGTIQVDNYKDKSMISVSTDETNVAVSYDKKTTKYEVSYNKTVVASGTYKEEIKKNSISFDITFDIPLAKIDGKLNVKVESVDKIDAKSYSGALDVMQDENAAKLYQEIQDNEFIMQIGEMITSYMNGGSSWTTVDGIE